MLKNLFLHYFFGAGASATDHKLGGLMMKYHRVLATWSLAVSYILTGSICIVACGTSKDSVKNSGGSTETPLPDLKRPNKPVVDKDTLVLKTEDLKLTHITQAWGVNSFTQDLGAVKYLKLQKKFIFPIQFNGWVTLDRVEHNYSNCAQEISSDPAFILEDDHNGAVPILPGEKIPISREKLYILRLEYANTSFCKRIGIQFGVLYGTNE